MVWKGWQRPPGAAFTAVVPASFNQAGLICLAHYICCSVQGCVTCTGPLLLCQSHAQKALHFPATQILQCSSVKAHS